LFLSPPSKKLLPATRCVLTHFELVTQSQPFASDCSDFGVADFVNNKPELRHKVFDLLQAINAFIAPTIYRVDSLTGLEPVRPRRGTPLHGHERLLAQPALLHHGHFGMLVTLRTRHTHGLTLITRQSPLPAPNRSPGHG
jgi:hypothetical protein